MRGREAIAPKWRLALFAFALPIGSSQTASAEPPKELQACMTSYDQGQRLKANGELRRAREQLLICAAAPCPVQMIADCAGWFTEVQKLLPSALITATDAAGHEVSDVRVRFDGSPLLERLTGRAVDVDPGEHVFRFEPAIGPPVERRVLVHEGEKGQRIEVQLGESSSAAPKESPKEAQRQRSASPPVAAYVAGGIGVLALGSFAVFGISGLNQRQDLLPCRGACADADVDALQRKFLIADVSLGISVVAFGVATILWLSHRGEPARVQSAFLPR